MSPLRVAAVVVVVVDGEEEELPKPPTPLSVMSIESEKLSRVSNPLLISPTALS